MRIMSATYVATLSAMVISSAVLCLAARRRPGRWIRVADFVLGMVLVVVSVTWLVQTATQPHWSAATSLPFALCDMATLVAAAALFWRSPILVELTYFWGLAGTVQALLTPDVQVGFPSLVFLEYVIAHAGIVCAALFLVVGQQRHPRPKSAPRVLGLTLAYTALVGMLDAVSGGNYMYLRRLPHAWTLLSVLGPWPWYLASATGVAVLLLTVLDAPFWRERRRLGLEGASRSSDRLEHQYEHQYEHQLPTPTPPSTGIEVTSRIAPSPDRGGRR